MASDRCIVDSSLFVAFYCDIDGSLVCRHLMHVMMLHSRLGDRVYVASMPHRNNDHRLRLDPIDDAIIFDAQRAVSF